MTPKTPGGGMSESATELAARIIKQHDSIISAGLIPGDYFKDTYPLAMALATLRPTAEDGGKTDSVFTMSVRDDLVVTAAPIGFTQTKPNFNITLSNDAGEVGKLDFNGPEMVFTGKAEESAKVFFDWVAKEFSQRLANERAAALSGRAGRDAERWQAFCNLWAASTVLEALQDESGYWVLRQIEPAEEITFQPLVGETPEAAIDLAIAAHRDSPR